MDDHPPTAGITVAEDGTARCWWAGSDPLYVDYHDREWGFPVVDDRRLFEKLCLEGFQAGLSWLTILRKREAFRRACSGCSATKGSSDTAARSSRRSITPRARSRSSTSAARWRRTSGTSCRRRA